MEKLHGRESAAMGKHNSWMSGAKLALEGLGLFALGTLGAITLASVITFFAPTIVLSPYLLASGVAGSTLAILLDPKSKLRGGKNH